MALENIDGSKIKAPTQELVTNLVKGCADPEIYVEWLLLFDEYNQAHPDDEKHMACRPCYGKVYQWFIKMKDEQKS